jgi:purine nucleosidase
MGGAVRATGDMPSPSTEFNVASDPEAAAIVLERWPGAALVPWETAMQCFVSLAQLEELWAVQTPRGAFVRRITARQPSVNRELFGMDGVFVADPVAMAVAIDPAAVARSERRHVTVERCGQYTRGQTTVDWFQPRRWANVEVVTEVDRDRFWTLLPASVGS